MDIQYRSFTMHDYEAAAWLWKSSEGIGLSAADSRPRIEAYLNRNPGMSFTAWNGDQLVGAVLAGHDGRRGYLHHLAVDSKFQGQGIGKKLAELCEKALAEEGIEKIHIFVYQTNIKAQEFWSSCGWYKRPDITLMSFDNPMVEKR